MNKIVVKGRLSKSPETRHTNTGKMVTSFSVAVNGVGKDAKTEYVNCIAWDKLAEVIANHCDKGSEVLVVGRLQTRSYDSKGTTRYITEVIVNEFEFCGSKQDKQQNRQSQQSQPEFGSPAYMEEDIPF